MKIVLHLRLAIGFLTRVPVGNVQTSDEEFARSLRFFPIVGALIGLALGVTAWLLGQGLSPAIVAGLLLALLAALTGGLHLDGIADVFDGLGGGRGDVQRTLKIMRDSRIGAHGAVALIIYLLIKFAALSQLVAAEEYFLLALAPFVARALVVPAIVLVPYVRQQGLGSSFKEYAGLRELWPVVAVSALAIALAGTSVAFAFAWSGLALVAAAAFLISKLRGLTGDGYGLLIELGELAFIVALTWN